MTRGHYNNVDKVPCRCGKPGVLASPWGWLCVAHYARWKKHDDPLWAIPLQRQALKGQGLSRHEIHLWNRCRITQVQFDQMLDTQGGVCGLCGSPDHKGRGTFSVDHDHDCQHERWPRRSKVVAWGGTPTRVVPLSFLACPDCIRGLLCNDCNQNMLPSLEKGLKLGLVSFDFALVEYLAGRPCKKDPGDG